MNSSNNNVYSPNFSHIYIETEAYSYAITRKILNSFANAVQIPISHYKDIFCKSHQNFCQQKQSISLILAVKHSRLIYPGAPVCQSFGNEHFYYTSSIMNCPFDCEYCYLQGMYPSANIVIFVNLEDIFEQVRLLLKKHPVYLCISYDTDLFALEPLLSYAKRWNEFVLAAKGLTVELRTKAANRLLLSDFSKSSRFIWSFTLSPDRIQTMYEHHTPALIKRLLCVQTAISLGFPVRLCFDPLLFHKDWKQIYTEFLEEVFHTLPGKKIFDISIGVFRVSSEYLSKMRKNRLDSSVLAFPYENDNGVFHYNKRLTSEMIAFIKNQIKRYVPEEKIFIWEANQ